jgi:hypothetical protein
MALAILLLAISAAVHFGTYVGMTAPQEFIGVLAAGIFVTFIPAVLLVGGRAHWRMPSLEDVFNSLPKPFGVVNAVITVYVCANFFITILRMPGVPEQRANQYVLNDHGHFTPITVEQYQQFRAAQIRLVAGFSIGFQYGSFVLLLASTGLARRVREPA